MKNPKSSLILIALAVLLFITGIVVKVVQSQQPATVKHTEVKEQTIPMNLNDFQDDPHIQGAIQQQLQQQQGTPQQAAGEGHSGDSQLLQPVPNGLQTQQQ
jgi:anionic cell wall polymer biosynthesis LytR-Cps2A-Psr (LCP) family protein